MNCSLLIKNVTMKRNILSLFLGLTTFSGFAQITIVSTDVGQVGDQVIVVTDELVSGKMVAPASSNAQTFDYSGLSFSTTDSYDFLAPMGNPGASDFPNADILLVSGGGVNLNYMTKSTSAFELDGVYGDPYGIGSVNSLDFNPNVMIMPFPLNYADNFNSTQQVDTTLLDTVTGLFDSLRVVSRTTISSTIDAFGTLNLPNTTADVLRKYDVEVREDTIFGLIFGTWQNVQQAVSTRYFYRFVAKNKDYYMLQAEADSLGNVVQAEFQLGASLIAGVSNQSGVSCNGLSDGMIELLSLGGTSPYTFAWSDGQTGNIASGLAAGPISVVVTDAVNATFTLNLNVNEPDAFDLSNTQVGADYGFSDGFVQLDVQGGTPSFSYSWSNGETTKNIADLDFGTYTVTIVDANGCSKTESFNVDDITSVKSLSETSLISVYPNPASEYVNIETRLPWVAKLVSLDAKAVAQFQGNGNRMIKLDPNLVGIYFLVITTEEGVYQTKLILK